MTHQPLAWLILLFSIYGMIEFSKWAGEKVGELALEVDQWAQRRAMLLVGQAILDDEWERTGNLLHAHRFAHKIMGTVPA